MALEQHPGFSNVASDLLAKQTGQVPEHQPEHEHTRYCIGTV